MTTDLIDTEIVAQPVMKETRPLYWSIRRELWEHRSIILGPLLVAAVVFFGLVLSLITLPHRRRAVMLLDEAHQREAIGMPYNVIATVLILTSFVVAVFYCLDALHGERRDRSILFWKSLPVSDLTTVLSKASIPLVVLPLYVFFLALIAQLIMLTLTNAVLIMSGFRASTLASQLKFFPSPIPMIYGIFVIALWHAPLHAWLLLVSGWAKRAVFLWAVFPFVAISIVEKIAFNTSYFGKLLQYRLIGGIERAFAFQKHVKGGGMEPVPMTPERFFGAPGLWLGLIVAVLFLVAAVRLRRDRQPI